MDDSEIVVRQYEPHDHAAVLALAPRLGYGIAPWRDGVATRRAAEGWLSDSCSSAARGDSTVFVGLSGGTIAGVVSATESRHFTGDLDAYVGELVVSPDCTRRGIGRALMTRVEQWARERGLRCITLHTGAANDIARAFYGALGFESEDIRLTHPLDTNRLA